MNNIPASSTLFQAKSHTASGEWARLDALRAGLMSRLERLSQLTLPSVLPPTHYDTNTYQLTHGHNSLGSQAATHLVNKLMLSMFAPSRPFMRLDIPPELQAELMETLNIGEDVLLDTLANGERAAMRSLEQAGQRQTLFTIMTHLVVLGNVLLDLSGDTLQATSIRNYVVQRNTKGKVTSLVIREVYRMEDLEDSIKAEYRKTYPRKQDHDPVCLYTWVVSNGPRYTSTMWVDDMKLPDSFSGSWPEEDVPYRPLIWTLPLHQSYGVGRCEEYANDLAEHENLSTGLSDGAALATAFRWLANPAGVTRPEDIANAPNGGVIPGINNDVSLLFANVGQQLATVSAVKEEVSRRIGQGFLLNSSVTRQAERVTAEEIRIQAQELESSLGGAYSRLALDIQHPLAKWLLKRAQIKVEGTQIEPVIVTGLDALSRNSDRDRLMYFLQDLASLDGIQPDTRTKLKEPTIISDLAAGHGVDRSRVIATPEETQAAEQRLQERQMAVAMAEQGVPPQ